MGKSQRKTGKGRLDKYYKLAKEQGYRARSAFKLIQLNKKYNFLEKSKVLIDLCAAPGGWLQVASKYMPVESLIVGVDLVPIRPIPRCTSFVEDITTDKCRAALRGHLKTWKADVVLHDGAPNVGTAWLQDAYSQAELVLSSLKLACEFLVKGGLFITKVFRSKDYNNLLWVFSQLFDKVEATKPPSSRNVSAEIFVVCRGFKAPLKIDPKFLSAKSVFEELPDPEVNQEASVFHPEKKKRHRDGYDEGDYTLFKEFPVSEFVRSAEPIQILGRTNKIGFPVKDEEAQRIKKSDHTTEEILACCTDLKVLGKKDFRNLLRWRASLRDELCLNAKKAETTAEETVEIEPVSEEQQMEDEIKQLSEEQNTLRKRSRRRLNERKQKNVVRMQLGMLTPKDIGIEQTEMQGKDSVFSLKQIEKQGVFSQVADGEMAVDVESSDDDLAESDGGNSEDEDDLDGQLDVMYETYQERKAEMNARYRAQKSREEVDDTEFRGFSDRHDSGDDSVDEDMPSNTLITSLEKEDKPSVGLTRKAALFFNQDIFQEQEGSDLNATVPRKKENKQEPVRDEENDVARDDGLDWDMSQVETAKEPAVDIVTEEAMTLAHKIALKQVKIKDLIDEGFNKHAFYHKQGLPDWFLDDEKRHTKPNIPITAEAAAAVREKLRALNARPIKKVMEAKARKKMKAARKMLKVQQKADVINDTNDMSEKEKASNIQKLMNRAAKKKPKQQVKVVVARGANRGVAGRPKGVGKGKYKVCLMCIAIANI
ncbi:AdoMet-dependent rRNA methyltransferase spb1 [Neolecta irregularis DAH-3]|uniref:AdoMet-dependent rRNA methyltransferase spb1 n=1 Tax=Neolecta irregularis (strain DAH-3) TaxID=1198029 RepID=A0A1U7LWM0_NEOID|nr:AdoMet-dependent rRNA methyltransferase spb1 [Neolecta irregularis DAH-3]|eukprot:OLL27034.1 AdoMet-dependent rRNA methyltransferase spb1 [Neolecta irregularis DAH-3]